MSESLIIALATLAVKYGPDVAIAFAKLFKGSATIDDAIAALEVAKTKTADDYIEEAKKAQVVETPVVATTTTVTESPVSVSETPPAPTTTA